MATKRPFAVIYRFHDSPRVRVWANYATREKADALAKKLEEQGWIVWVEEH